MKKVSLITSILLVLLVFCSLSVLGITFFIGRPFEVIGNSMNPAINDKDKVLIQKQDKYKSKDIVIFYNRNNDSYIIGRIIGIQYDLIKITSNAEVYLNNNLLIENYIPSAKITRAFDNPKLDEEVVVPTNSYYILADNRDNSVDSRNSTIGFIDKLDIIGKVIFRYYPLEKFGILN